MHRTSLISGARVSALIGGACLVGFQPVMAATWCVNNGGTGGCKSSIGAAVSAAAAGDIIQVAAGNYAEDVHIQKSLSLVGAGLGLSIINATGLANGIFIDGTSASPNTGVSGVTVQGFTIEKLNLRAFSPPVRQT